MFKEEENRSARWNRTCKQKEGKEETVFNPRIQITQKRKLS
jgi:hypothetical protein